MWKVFKGINKGFGVIYVLVFWWIDIGNKINLFDIWMLLSYMIFEECVLKYCVKFEFISF